MSVSVCVMCACRALFFYDKFRISGFRRAHVVMVRASRVAETAHV